MGMATMEQMSWQMTHRAQEGDLELGEASGGKPLSLLVSHVWLIADMYNSPIPPRDIHPSHIWMDLKRGKKNCEL